MMPEYFQTIQKPVKFNSDIIFSWFISLLIPLVNLPVYHLLQQSYTSSEDAFIIHLATPFFFFV